MASKLLRYRSQFLSVIISLGFSCLNHTHKHKHRYVIICIQIHTTLKVLSLLITYLATKNITIGAHVQLINKEARM
jgi:hypothetical protein